jgi:hypothetical protein
MLIRKPSCSHRPGTSTASPQRFDLHEMAPSIHGIACQQAGAMKEQQRQRLKNRDGGRLSHNWRSYGLHEILGVTPNVPWQP